MAVQKPPTERQRRLGTELPKMRERADLVLTLDGMDVDLCSSAWWCSS